MNTIRILFSCASNLDWDLQQFDVKNAVLHRDLEEEVYREIPPGFDTAQSQGKRKYILDLLKETGMTCCRPAESLVERNHKLQGEVGESVDKERYQRLVGRLIYLSHTRPDIVYSISLVSQFMHDPRDPHMQVVFHILRYLRSCLGKGVLLSKHDYLQIEAFIDVNWAGSLNDRRSTSGYCTLVGGNLVTWRSKKQNVVA
ncbi:secreted RxLR effector protein 161-like [Nicotiana sylvestris]|uniref:secreted RxLR effector protein 161-like n=1 Tax=Nicotiana sylvestris TaxID=4096 RepID=UPI00388CB7DC